jgi:hypothetical protein
VLKKTTHKIHERLGELTARAPVENRHKKKSNKQAEENARKHREQDPAGWEKGHRMSGFVGLAGVAVGSLFLALAYTEYGKGGYHNALWALIWGILGYGIFGLGLVGGYWYYVINPAGADTDKAASERPEVLFESISMKPLRLGEPPEVIAIFKNFGKATAYRLNFETNLGLHFISSPEPLEYPTGGRQVKTDLPPGEWGRLDTVPPAPTEEAMTKEYLKDIEDGEGFVFFYGRLRYQDVSGKNFVWPFCYMYDPQEPKMMRNCPDAYLPKENSN